MDVKEFVVHSSIDTLINKIAELSDDRSTETLTLLHEMLLTDPEDTFTSSMVPRIVSRGLLQRGKPGIDIIQSSIGKGPKIKMSVACIEALWFATKGEYSSVFFPSPLKIPTSLERPIPVEMQKAAAEAFHDVVVQSRTDDESFTGFIQFLFQWNLLADSQEYENGQAFRNMIYDIFSEATIRLTKKLIHEAEVLITGEHDEETYHRFLSSNPVLIDPLSSIIISKQQLGVEYVTDYIIRRLDNEYIMVEIEKPQDRIFTKRDDFTAHFTHALGQIIDFQSWINIHGEYARSLLPGISSPKGLLIIGLRRTLSDRQKKKLQQLCESLNNISIITYDDLLKNVNNFYNNIHVVNQ